MSKTLTLDEAVERAHLLQSRHSASQATEEFAIFITETFGVGLPCGCEVEIVDEADKRLIAMHAPTILDPDEARGLANALHRAADEIERSKLDK